MVNRKWWIALLVGAGSLIIVVMFWSGRLPSWLPGRSSSGLPAPETEAGATRDGAFRVDTADDVTDQQIIAEAVLVAKSLVDHFPDQPYPYDIMAGGCLLQGRSREAERCWEQCLELDSRFVSAHYGLAHIAIGRGEYEKVVRSMDEVLALHPDSPKAVAYLGNALIELGRFEEAIRLLQRHVESGAHSPGTFHMLGKAYLQLGDCEKAKENYQSALALDPHFADAYYGVAAAYRKLKMPDKAKQCLSEFRRCKSRDRSPSGRMPPVFEAALLRQRTANLYLAAGELCGNNGDLQTAEQYWRKATGLDPTNVGAYRTLAELYRRLGRSREASQMLANVRRIESNTVGQP